jgi:hypothetical protein
MVDSSTIIVLTICGLIISYFIMCNDYISKEDTYNDDWWWYRRLYEHKDLYAEAHTDIMDRFVMKNCIVKSKKIKENHEAVPASGNYQYTPTDMDDYINIRKMRLSKNNKEVYEYIVYAKTTALRARFILDLFEFMETDDTVAVMSIDTSGDTPNIIQINKVCGTPRANQQDVIDMILDHWTDEKHHRNTKVIINGERGTGKTYIARLLKKHIQESKDDEKYANCRPIVYDDINPSSIGVNINKIILTQATASTPVILLINEMDTFYDMVINGKDSFDPRLQHTRNRNEFHNLLDNIGDVPNLIAIYTMESDPIDLNKNDNYKSFLRQGRVDFFIHLTTDDATKTVI